ncbi:MAG: ABC transporter ATP-binding protein [Synergistetes bacterium]|nr:ABC transporter ATP-binding protein [Synergistota bacterium]
MEKLVEVEGVKKYFPVFKGVFRRVAGWVKAVDGVTFFIKKGETLGLVGESGCGKSTLGLTLLKLIPPDAGKIFFQLNEDRKVELSSISSSGIRSIRRLIQIIFQDPYSSLNPRMRVREIIGEGLLIHGLASSKREAYAIVGEVLERVGLLKEHLNRYPHEFSGGQRQRIVIARALALKPSFIVCDEPVSALDVSVRSQVLNLLKDLQEEYGLTYLFISHDLSVVKHISDRIAVMYLGKIVEKAEKRELFEKPLHPYTRALLSAVPHPDPKKRGKRIILHGDVPSPLNPPSGCRFHPRCPFAIERCSREEPAFRDVGGGHFIACHRVGEI